MWSRRRQCGQNMVLDDQITSADTKCHKGSNQGEVTGGQRGGGEEPSDMHLPRASCLGVMQTRMLPKSALHSTPYTVCVSDPQGSEQAMRGGTGGSLLKVRAGSESEPTTCSHLTPHRDLRECVPPVCLSPPTACLSGSSGNSGEGGIRVVGEGHEIQPLAAAEPGLPERERVREGRWCGQRTACVLETSDWSGAVHGQGRKPAQVVGRK